MTSIVYHTAQESMRRFTALRPTGASRCGDGPCYWTLEDGNGNTYYFGGDPLNNLATSTGPTDLYPWTIIGASDGHSGVASWLLRKFVDHLGNSYEVEYRALGSERYPSRVAYTLPAAPYNHELLFDVTSRPDIVRVPYELSQRLQTLTVRTAAAGTAGAMTVVRTYHFNYATSPASGRSRLESVSVSGSQGGTLPPTVFEYSAGGLSAATGGPLSPPETNLQSFSAPTTRYTTLSADIDADGRADIIRVTHDPESSKRVIEWEISTGVNFSVPYHYDDLYGQDFAAPGYINVLVGDVNGDLRADLILAYSGAWIYVDVMFGFSSGLLPPVSVLAAQPPQPVLGPPVLAADVNGDQRTDLVFRVPPIFATTDAVYYALSDGVQMHLGTASGSPSAPQLMSVLRGQATNFDGDHTTDVASIKSAVVPESCFVTQVQPSYELRVQRVLGTSSGASVDPTTIISRSESASPVGTTALSGDFNGDGNADIVLLYRGPAGAYARDCTAYPFLGNLDPFTIPFGSEARLLEGPRLAQLVDLEKDPSPREGCSLAFDRNAPLTSSWEHHAGDINGDGIDDIVQVYRGGQGTRIRFSLGTRQGPGPFLDMPPDMTPAADHDLASHRWQSRLADINGDGIADLLLLYYGPLGLVVQYALGSPAGLLAPVGPSALERSDLLVGGDGGGVDFLVDDFNGDGRADIVAVQNQEDLDPSEAQIRYVFSVPGQPDLLTKVVSPLGGRWEATYRHPVQLAGAIDVDDANPCTDSLGPNAGAVCGAPAVPQRSLVQMIASDNGRGRRLEQVFEYFNGRVLTGPPSMRKTLGFERIVRDSAPQRTDRKTLAQAGLATGSPLSVSTELQGRLEHRIA